MLVVMKADAPQKDVDAVCEYIRDIGLTPHPMPGPSRLAVCITGNTGPIDPDRFATLPGVIEVIRVTRPFKLTSRDMKPDDTVINIGGVRIGGKDIVVIAGPCAVESRQQMIETAFRLKELGAQMLRGGAFNDFSQLLRCASRSRYSPVDGSWGIGFRVVVSPSGPGL